MSAPSPGCSTALRVVAPDRLNAGFIVSSVLDPQLTGAAAGVARAA